MKSLAITSTIVLMIATVLAMMFFLSSHAEPVKAAGFQSTNIGAVATTSANFLVTTSSRVLATTSNSVGTGFTRVYATICNPNANPVALNLDGDKAANSVTGNVTTWIASAAGYNVCYEIRDVNQYLGSITASSTSETATRISVKDYVQ